MAGVAQPAEPANIAEHNPALPEPATLAKVLLPHVLAAENAKTEEHSEQKVVFMTKTSLLCWAAEPLDLDVNLPIFYVLLAVISTAFLPCST